MAVLEIPLGTGAQSFRTTLLGISYQLQLVWRETIEGGGWVLDIASADGTALMQGIPLVTGCDLLGQYAYLSIGGELWVATDGDPDAAPTYDSLGDTSRLYFVTP
jgi:hypothetical protein